MEYVWQVAGLLRQYISDHQDSFIVETFQTVVSFESKLFNLTMRKIKVCFLSFPFCKRKGDFESAKDVHFYFYRLEQRHFGAETDFCKTIAGSDQPTLYIIYYLQ